MPPGQLREFASMLFAPLRIFGHKLGFVERDNCLCPGPRTHDPRPRGMEVCAAIYKRPMGAFDTRDEARKALEELISDF